MDNNGKTLIDFQGWIIPKLVVNMSIIKQVCHKPADKPTLLYDFYPLGSSCQ